MLTVIIGCIIANLLTIVIIGASLYLVYRKNQDKIDAAVDKIEEKIANVKEEIASVKEDINAAKEAINSVTSTIEDIKNALDKFPFK